MFSNKQERLLHLDSTSRPGWLLRCREVRLGSSPTSQSHQSSTYLCFFQGKDQTMLPIPAPQPATEQPMALHCHIHTSSSVLQGNWEGREDQSTHSSSSLPAQGQELTDVGPHQSSVTCRAPWVPLWPVAGKQKSPLLSPCWRFPHE